MGNKTTRWRGLRACEEACRNTRLRESRDSALILSLVGTGVEFQFSSLGFRFQRHAPNIYAD